MRELLTAIGRFVVGLFCRVGRFGLFSWTLFLRLGGAKFSQVVQQIHFIGNYSLLIIAVSGLFVGFVLGLQGTTCWSLTAVNRRSAPWLRWPLCGNSAPP